MSQLFLIGFMAAGKTSVGRAVASASGRRFVDLDVRIAALGEPVAALVARDLPEFRRREAETLQMLIADREPMVIATGGGAAAFGDNLTRMRAAGLVVALGVDVVEAERRAVHGPARPLLARAAQLAAERAPVYRRAHAVVDTMGKAVAQVASEVRAVELSWQRLPDAHRHATLVSLGDRTYPVSVTDTLDRDLVRAQPATQLAVITDRNVLPHASGLGDAIVIEPGEASKSFDVYARLCSELIARGLDRSSAIVAVGGGVVGDLAGFVAATLFRGIPVTHVPTTIVA
ncbi:MAG: shikimate kinase, partial [Kofleriaceae bacterium]